MRQVFGAFAEYDRVMIVSRLKAARQRKKIKDGYCEGQKPYGTRPGEQAVIDRIKGLRTNGLSYVAISDALNASGTKPRRGQRWYPSSVRNVLRRLSA